jgi:hypothetical protein
LARIIGDLGSEKTLIEELHNLGIRSLRSLTDVENHLDSSGSRIESLKDAERMRVHEEIEAMRSKHSEFTEERTQQRTKRLEFLTDKRDMLRRKLGEPEEDTRSPFKFVTQKYRRWSGLPASTGPGSQLVYAASWSICLVSIVSAHLCVRARGARSSRFVALHRNRVISLLLNALTLLFLAPSGAATPV